MSASLRIALAGAALAALALQAAPVSASPSAVSRGADACAVHAPEASQRSGLPVDVLLRVMHVESRGRPLAISHKGAMGCMQIMPGTWADLTRRYGLGRDPWNPRMNTIGGALYLAELVRQFGYPGAYSAYNAGPGRYMRYVRGGVPLPAETVAYTAHITGGAAAPVQVAAAAERAAPRWQEASLFLVRPRDAPIETGRSDRPVQPAPVGPSPASAGLFPLARPSDTP